MQTQKCSVVIPTYNRADLLRHTLESLTKQRLSRDEFEVLVVDDGSSDGTALVVDGYRERLNLRYFYQDDEGWRTAKARNVGIAHAQAPVCVFIDSGVLAHSGCLEAHVASHRGHAEPVAVCGYVYGFNEDNQEAELIYRAIDFDDIDATIGALEKSEQHLDIREDFYRKYTDDFGDVPAPWVVFWTCNVSAPTDLIRSVGSFDEAFRSWGGEDLDLGYRLHRGGARFIVSRRASAIHCPHHKDFTENDEGAAANYAYIARKYDNPITDLLQYSPVIHPWNMNDIIRLRERMRERTRRPVPA
jgi:glycosyltransferase involved in cell wall biosynthesis